MEHLKPARPRALATVVVAAEVEVVVVMYRRLRPYAIRGGGGGW